MNVNIGLVKCDATIILTVNGSVVDSYYVELWETGLPQALISAIEAAMGVADTTDNEY